jgi:hypothetical protein
MIGATGCWRRDGLWQDAAVGRSEPRPYNPFISNGQGSEPARNHALSEAQGRHSGCGRRRVGVLSEVAKRREDLCRYGGKWLCFNGLKGMTGCFVLGLEA